MLVKSDNFRKFIRMFHSFHYTLRQNQRNLSNLSKCNIDGAPADFSSNRRIRAVCDARQKPVFDGPGRQELEAFVEIEVPEDLLARLELIKSGLKATTMVNEPNIEAINTLKADVNKLLDQKSS